MKRQQVPIVILGAARSGTTLIGNLLDMHNDIAYWPEPNYIWKYRSAFLGHDAIPGSFATKKRMAFIQDTFQQFAGEKIFMEKTPANCLRVEFVHKVLPDAKFIHIIRDGREVALSVKHQWERTRDNNKLYAPNEDTSKFREIKKRLAKIRQVSLLDLPFYFPLILDSLLSDLKIKSIYNYWGPRFPGFKDYQKAKLSRIEISALQWKNSIDTVINYKTYIDPNNYMEIKYENFIENPIKMLNEIFDFIGLEKEDYIEKMSLGVKKSISKWDKELSNEEINDVNKLIGYTLNNLGYV